MEGKRQTGSDGAVEGGRGERGVRGDGMLRKYVRRCLTGRWREERVLRGLGEQESPQRCNPVNTAHSPDWRHSPHHREEAGVCR